MKKLIMISAVVLALAGAVSGSDKQLGAGIAVGDVPGITGKVWIDKRLAVEGFLSFVYKSDVYVQVNVLYHDFEAFGKLEGGQLPFYYGAGVSANSPDRSDVHGVAGAEYLFDDYPFGIFMELNPTIALQPERGFYFTAFLGARYYWGQTPKAAAK